MRAALHAVLLALCAAAPPTGPAAPAAQQPAAPSSLADLAARLAAELGPPADGRRLAALVVETRAPALAAPLGSALDAALGSRGYSVTILRSPSEAEAAARAAGQDWLVRVQAGLVPGRRELGAVAELVPTWPSFFLQRQPGAHAVPPRVVQARVPADPETTLLARETRPAGAPFAVVRALARVPGRVLALAAGEPAAPGQPAIVAVTATALLVLTPSGEVVARRDLDASAWRPVRGPAAVVAVADLGGGRIALRLAGAPSAEVYALEGDRLARMATLPAAPLCAGDRGAVFGAFAPGTGMLLDQLSHLVDPDARPASARLLYGVTAAPHAGPVAFAALGADLRLALLGPDLTPASAPAAPGEAGGPIVLSGVGSGFALADLDGDGTPEVVASSADPSGSDRLRVLPARAGAAPLLETGPLEGAVLSGAGGDLTGDGVDDAILGAVVDGAHGEETVLLLVTGDPREVR